MTRLTCSEVTLVKELRASATYESLVTPTRLEIKVLLLQAATGLEDRDQLIMELLEELRGCQDAYAQEMGSPNE
jgi:hypothetical protein